MDETVSNEESEKKLQDLYSQALNLCRDCDGLKTIAGSWKLLRKCQSELDFLRKVKSVKLQQCHINSTNVCHLQGIVTAARRLPHVTGILRKFNSRLHKGRTSDGAVVVDVVCNSGKTWVKVIARNVKALNTDVEDRQPHGVKSLMTHASQFLQLAEENPCAFDRPNICFLFNYNVPSPLCDSLQSLGVVVMTLANLSDRPPTTKSCHCNIGDTLTELDLGRFATTTDTNPSVVLLDWYTSSENCNERDCHQATDASWHACVNLDITALIALVSNVSNGHCNYTFQDDLLTQQAVEERISPVLPVIQSFIAGKRWYVCRTALAQFRSIIDTIAGPSELERARQLLDRVCVVDDQPSVRSSQLELSRRITSRALTVFATGDHLRAVTVTANKSFVRAAAQAGLEFVAYLHQARALTEQKQATARIVETVD